MEYEQKSQSIITSIGYFFFSWMPLICFLLIQIVVGIGGMMFTIIMKLLYELQNGTGGINIESLLSDDMYMSNIMWVLCMYQIVSLAVFSIWYYFQNDKKVTLKAKFSKKDILSITVLGVSINFLIGIIVIFFQVFFPKLMEEYQQLIEQSGIGEVTFISMFTTIIMAPLVEELVFRGVTYQIAYKINHSFWVANIIQALAFGIGHMNIIQGIYAFLLGIIMGCVYRRYRSIYATMLLHAVFNFSGTVLTGALEKMPFSDSAIFNIILILLSVIGTAISLKMMKTD